ncbi:type II secretion system F family protein [Microbacterium sp. No. 7]|uniref:type II secretion system F family protein n=1 Tax=Microbacterium sp. No. 7 TaxID=1714373 RepID=UPI0006ECF517|nr:type II secretion system F family protein [Microbacterium sp. No. 7]ALJ19473.1 pilus assembly protein TadB [Microbacterium sp. No. 7]
MTAPDARGVETAPDATPATETVQRMAVLLEAGLAPARAWECLAAGGDAVAGEVCDAAARGEPVADVLRARGGAWRHVAVAWHVAETVGAPLASSLRGFADALRDAQRSRDDVRVALAEPTATARLVSWLPLVAVGLTVVLGFDVGAVVTHPAGIACVAAGTGLIVLARRWTSRLVAAAQPPAEPPGLQADVVAIALSGGVSVERALDVVADAGGGAPDGSTAAVLDLSARAGAPAVELLRAAAVDARHTARTDGRLRAARLGARLLLPLGVCTLPAFLLLGVAPMLLSVLSGAPVPL